MNAMLDRLRRSAERQRRFVADASHELRSPLASTRAQLEVALSHPDPSGWEATASDLLSENHRMERLVNDLLFLARTGRPRPGWPGPPSSTWTTSSCRRPPGSGPGPGPGQHLQGSAGRCGASAPA